MKRLNQVKSMKKLHKRTKTRWQRLGSSITSLCVALGVTGLAGAPAMAALESVTAYGQYWNWDTNNNYRLVSTGYLHNVPRYAAGPCDGKFPPFTSPCKFDSRTIATINGKRLESVTAYGKFWNWEIDNNYKLASSGNLKNVTRYASGPCQNVGSNDCVFDTRAIVTLGGRQMESVTAYGQFWNWDANTGQFLSSGILANVDRYGKGPCQNYTNFFLLSCQFGSREFFSVSGGFLESVTAYGKFWNFESQKNYQPIEGPAGKDLTEVQRYKEGPCKDRVRGDCNFDTRAFLY